jgi:hypothetical protein
MRKKSNYLILLYREIIGRQMRNWAVYLKTGTGSPEMADNYKAGLFCKGTLSVRRKGYAVPRHNSLEELC